MSDYLNAFALTPIDYIDTHVYPVNDNYLMNTLTAAQIAQTAGKGYAISEAWDYKVRDSELNHLSPTTLYGRDPFSFWAPVDQAFLNSLVDLANAKNLVFLAPFWSHYQFAYLDYATEGTKSSSQVLSDSYTAAGTANSTGLFTSTGLTWMAQTYGTDHIAPAIPPAPTSTSNTKTLANIVIGATTDNVAVAGYNLYRNGALIYTTSAIFAYTDLNLTANTTYTYAVSAFDANGNESLQSPTLVVDTSKARSN